jgi:hypothetical protein
MRRSLCGRVALIAALCASPAWSAEVESGSYEVEVKLELPHLEDRTQTKIVNLCLTADPAANTHGIAVLSDNNPLSRCPFVNQYETGNQISFDIICDGKNSGNAKAHYVFNQGRFQGRITMQMGGKNMTMTEVQSGHRTGPCATGQAPTP